MLGAIGLDDAHEMAYRMMVRLGALEAGDLARRLGSAEEDVLSALRALEQQGLVTRSRRGSWVAAPPAVALGPLLTRQRHELERAEQTAAMLAAEYRPEAVEPAVNDLMEFVTGASAMAQRFAQLQLAAEREVCALITGDPMAVRSEENTSEELAVTRGVTYRVVVGREVFADRGWTLAGVAEALGRGSRLRVVDQVPTKLIIADGVRAMLPLRGLLTEPAALIAHSSGLLEALVALFEAVWRQGLPLRLGSGNEVEEAPDPGPEALDLRILSLMLAGLTDVSVAKELDLGVRTVQRRIKRLMELSGTTTRLQLGWHASELGWITRGEKLAGHCGH